MASAGVRQVGKVKNLRFQLLPDPVQQFGESGIKGGFFGARAKSMHIPHGREVFFDNAGELVWHYAPKSPIGGARAPPANGVKT